MKTLQELTKSLALIALLLCSANAMAITVVNTSLSGPDTDILCRNNPHPTLVQNCWTAGTTAGYNFRIANPGNNALLADTAFGSILGNSTLLYKAESSDSIAATPAAEEGALQGSYMTQFLFDMMDTDDGYSGANISYTGGLAVDCSMDCFLVIKDGNHNPAAYLFNLALGWDPLGARGGQPTHDGPPAWDGIMDLRLANFWEGNGGSISYLALYGSSRITSVPLPSSMWLFATALLGFIGIARSTRI